MERERTNLMREMSEAEWTTFIREGTRTGKLAVNLPSGRPTVTPIWFIHEDDGLIRMNTSGSSAKAKALAADPRACLLVDDEVPPFAMVKIDATARIIDDDPELLLRVATDIGTRYMGADRGEEFGQRNGGDGQVVIEFTPTRVVAADDIAG